MTLFTVQQVQMTLTGYQVDDGEGGGRIIPCSPAEAYVVEVLQDGIVATSRLFWSAQQAASAARELTDHLRRRPDALPYVGRPPSPLG